MLIKNEITVGDLIAMAGFIAAAIGLFLTFYQILKSNKHKRAEFIMDFCKQFMDSNDLLKMYYDIEYGSFHAPVFGSHSSEEVQLDKLLMLFENVSTLYEMGNICLKDLSVISYYFIRVYENEGVKQYLFALDDWCKKSGLPKRYCSFRNVYIVLSKNPQKLL
jgi:hypothetical protein